MRVRVRRFASVAGATLLLVCIPLGMTARGAETELFGYSGVAKGTAISSLYNQPSFGVPQDPTFELRKVYSTASLDSGPASHGLGSVLWPGDVVGNAPPALAFDSLVFNPTQIAQLNDVIAEIKKQGGEFTKGSSGYPVRAEAFYPSAKAQDEKDVGAGVRMAAQALEDRADGSSQTGGTGAGVISFGTIYSRSESVLERTQVISTSVTRITDLDLFGFVHIKSLLATATATSDGATGKTSGALEIAGMTIKDQEQKDQLTVNLDKTGLHVVYPDGKQDQDPLKALTDALKANLEPHGLTLSIGEPIDVTNGAFADRTLTGITLHLDATGMNTLLEDENFPAEVRNTLKNPTGNPVVGPVFGDGGLLSPTVAGFAASFFQGDQTMDFVFGSVGAQAVASGQLADITLPPTTTPPFGATPPLGGGFGDGGFAAPPAGGTGSPNLGILSGKPVAVLGIPLWALVLVLALAIAGATRLRLFADRVIAAAPAARCPLEER